MSYGLDRLLYKLWLYEVYPVSPEELAQPMFRLIAWGRVKGQNPRCSYFARKADERNLPYRINLIRKKCPLKKRRAAYRIQIVAEGMVNSLPWKLRKSKKALERHFHSFLSSLRLKGWKLYAVAGKKLKKTPKQSLQIITNRTPRPGYIGG